MKDKYENITVALAGVFQAASLVNDIAHGYTLNTDAFECSINSLFITSPENAISVYGEVDHLRYGLAQLIKAFSKGHKDNLLQVTRYSISLIHLQNALKKNTHMMEVIGKELDNIGTKREYFGPFHNNVIHALADVYQRTISTFKMRVLIMGKTDILNTPDTTAKCRAAIASRHSLRHFMATSGRQPLAIIIPSQKKSLLKRMN